MVSIGNYTILGIYALRSLYAFVGSSCSLCEERRSFWPLACFLGFDILFFGLINLIQKTIDFNLRLAVSEGPSISKPLDKKRLLLRVRKMYSSY